MPEHFTPSPSGKPSAEAKAAARQELVGTLVKELGIGYGAAMSIIDTAQHAVKESYDLMMSIVDRNSQVLNLTPSERAVLAMLVMRMMGATADTSMASAKAVYAALIRRSGG